MVYFVPLYIYIYIYSWNKIVRDKRKKQEDLWDDKQFKKWW